MAEVLSESPASTPPSSGTPTSYADIVKRRKTGAASGGSGPGAAGSASGSKKIGEGGHILGKNLRWIKAGQTMGMTDRQLVAYDYVLHSIDPKKMDKSFGTTLPDFDALHIPSTFKPTTFADLYKTRATAASVSVSPTVDSKYDEKGDDLAASKALKGHSSADAIKPSSPKSAKAAPLRYESLAKQLGMTEDQVVAYDYIQSLDPKVYEKSFGARPSVGDLEAPVRFKPTRKVSKAVLDKGKDKKKLPELPQFEVSRKSRIGTIKSDLASMITGLYRGSVVERPAPDASKDASKPE